MEIKRFSPAILKLFIPITILFITLFLFPAAASASQLVLNGDFRRDLAGWKTSEPSRGIETTWDTAGHTGAGSVQFKVSGRQIKGTLNATQQVATRIRAGSKGTVEFAWKKDWSTTLPLVQRIYVELIKPDKTTVTMWADKTVLNNNVWVSSSVDVTKFLNQDGRYALRVGADFGNGNAGAATTYAWFDNIRLNIATDLSTRPKTSLINPVGIKKLVGKYYPVGGVATDDVGIEKAEVAIVRLSDATYWNGNSWVKDEFWSRASITSGKGTRRATWSYLWPLSTSDGAGFKILARSEDVAGNSDVFPTESTVQVDNVGPTGSIHIKNTATYTNSGQLHINIDVKGASMMRFSPDNGITWTTWEKFAATKIFTMPKGDGEKVVSAQFMDDSENRYQISDSVVIDTTPPVTRHVFPGADTRRVPPSASISVTFYESMNPSTLKNNGTEQGSTIYIKQGSRWVMAKASYDERTKVAKLIPDAPLDVGTTYTVYLTDGIRDVAGNTLASNFSWSFTTTGFYRSSFKGTIGSEGGKLEDGNRTISLEVPQGALSADTVIAVEELRDKRVPQMTGLTRYSPVYQLTPDQLPLSAPATLRIAYKPNEVPDPTALRLVSYDNQQQKWLPVPDASIDLVNKQVTAPISRLMMIAITAKDDASAPATTIMSPMGAAQLTGRLYNIYGLSTDNSGISSVEVAISRQSDRAYWNGTDWQNSEAWVKARISAKKGRSSVTWYYSWTLPEDKYTEYQIRARATDSGGNVESSPSFVQVRLKGN